MNFNPNASLEELMAEAESRYSVAFEPVTVGDTSLQILQIADMGAHLEKLAQQSAPARGIELPFWAKIWPASLVLAHFMLRMPPEGKKALEIGAGVGVPGLFAAASGFKVTLTDASDDALLFARINILKNGLQDRAEIRFADFTASELGEKFDYMLCAECLYRPEYYRGLIKFLLRHLRKDGRAEAVIARDYNRKAEKFFKLAEPEFEMAEKTIGAKSAPGDEDGGAERHLVSIHRLRPRKHA